MSQQQPVTRESRVTTQHLHCLWCMWQCLCASQATRATPKNKNKIVSSSYYRTSFGLCFTVLSRFETNHETLFRLHLQNKKCVCIKKKEVPSDVKSFAFQIVVIFLYPDPNEKTKLHEIYWHFSSIKITSPNEHSIQYTPSINITPHWSDSSRIILKTIAILLQFDSSQGAGLSFFASVADQIPPGGGGGVTVKRSGERDFAPCAGYNSR